MPGRLDQLTGGYLFDSRIVKSFRDRGTVIRVAELPGTFPMVNSVSVGAAKELVRTLKDKQTLIIDGLALPAFASLLPLNRNGKTIGFIHHPLSLETGLTLEHAKYFTDLENSLWTALDGVICASKCTSRSVLKSGVAKERIQVASPGVDLPFLGKKSVGIASHEQKDFRLLCVATITPRKGHVVLIEALSKLRHYRWTLDCYGSLQRDPDAVHQVKETINKLGLIDRIKLHGEIPQDELTAAWMNADLFVLPSLHEGYGMVLTEAIAHGLPVVSTFAGAIPETAPQSASYLVEPGNSQALADTLGDLMRNPAQLESLRRAALKERNMLVKWPIAINRWHEAFNQLHSCGQSTV